MPSDILPQSNITHTIMSNKSFLNQFYFLPTLICLFSGLGTFSMLFNKYTFMFFLPNYLLSSMGFTTYFLIQGILKALKIPLLVISLIELGSKKFNFGSSSPPTPSSENLHSSTVNCNQIILKPIFLFLMSYLFNISLVM